MTKLMNAIKEFTNKEFGAVSTLTTNEGKILFKANDILEALGYKKNNWSTILNRKCKHITKCEVPNPQSLDKTIEMNFIPEGDVYRLIASSKLPSAEKFERWVFEEVLPNVRKTGMYIDDNVLDKLLSDPDTTIKILERYKEERTAREIAENKVLLLEEEKAINEHKVMAYEDFINCDETYSFSTVAKFLKIPRTPESKNFIGKNTLLAWLRRDDILMKQGKERNVPYQKYFNRDWFQMVAQNGEELSGKRSVRVTPRGIEGIYKMYRHSNMPRTIELEHIDDINSDNTDIKL